MRVLFAAEGWSRWQAALRRACPEVEFVTEAAPDSVDAILYAPDAVGGSVDFAAHPSARLVQSLWAGVERIVTDPTLTQPLARMVDPGLAQGMAEYCAGWALRLHLGMARFAQDGLWRADQPPPVARERRVTVLGAGPWAGRWRGRWRGSASTWRRGRVPGAGLGSCQLSAVPLCRTRCAGPRS